MRYLNRWSLSCVWLAAMWAAWLALVPGVLSPSTWVLTAIAGPVLIVGSAALWETSRPTPSFRQSQVAAEARDAAAAGRRP
jgi:hypothetical protein